MYINKRLLKFIDYIRENRIVSIKEAAEHLQVQERMIRYDIETLNFILEVYQLPVIKKEAKGRLVIEKEMLESEKLEEIRELNKYSKQERVEYIMFLLLVEGSVNLSKLSRDLDVSRTSIRKDIEEIKYQLKQYSIDIYDNQIDMEENTLRKVINCIFNEQLLMTHYKFIKENKNNLISEYFANNLEYELRSSIMDWMKYLNQELKSINTNYFDTVYTYIVISTLRIKNGYFIRTIDKSEYLLGTKEYKVVNRLIYLLEQSLSMKYSIEEKLILAELIQGYVSYSANTEILENWIEIVLAVKKMILNISQYSQINLLDDDLLMEGLLDHIKPAIYRIRNNALLQHEIYMDVVEPYQAIFTKVKSEMGELEYLVQKKFPDSEIALITIHFLAAVDRNSDVDMKKKKVLLVCGGGYGTTSLIKKQILELYNVEIKNVISYSDFQDYEIEDVDLIITTLNFDSSSTIKINLPLIKISPFLSGRDKRILSEHLKENGYNKKKIKRILNIIKENEDISDEDELIDKLEQELLHKQTQISINQKGLLDFIDVEEIKIIDEIENWRDSITESCDILLKSNDIKKSYVDEIMNIAENFGVHFVMDNHVALFHGEVGTNVNRSAIGLMFTKQMVHFPYEKMANLFFVLSAINTKDHVKSIEEIIKLIRSDDFMEKLISVNNKYELYQLIKLTIE